VTVAATVRILDPHPDLTCLGANNRCCLTGVRGEESSLSAGAIPVDLMALPIQEEYAAYVMISFDVW